MAMNLLDAPGIIDQGIEDLSTRELPPQGTSQAQHIPVIYGFAEKGPVGRHYLDLMGQTLTGVYGDETVRIGSPFHTHTTELAKMIAGEGNSFMFHRVLGAGAPDRSNASLWVDYLETEVPVYEKSIDGALQYDELGEPIPVMEGGEPKMIPGFKVCIVKDFTATTEVGELQIGGLSSRPGIQSENGKQSLQLPIVEAPAIDLGENGNGTAFRLWSPTKKTDDAFSTALLESGSMYPVYFAVSGIADKASGEIKVRKTRNGSVQVLGSLKPASIHPSTGGPADIESAIYEEYTNVRPELSSGIGRVHLYNDNIDKLLGMFYEAESAAADSFTDYPVAEGKVENRYAINLLGLVNSNGSPYQALKMVDNDESIRLTPNTNIFLEGGGDGEMTMEVLEAAVRADLQEYGSPLSPYLNIARNIESIIYDSGFSLETKLALPKMISLRKDTFVVLSTHIHGQTLTLEEQRSLGITLDTQLALYPESAYFGTPTVRGAIMLGSGKLAGSNYQDRVPTTFHVAKKTAAYMGASNGKWKAGYLFDKGEASVIDSLIDVDVDWIPAVSRHNFWKVGLNFPMSYDIRRVHFPALRTVYKNATSIFVSYFVALAAAYCNKVAHQVGREFSGDIRLSNAQLEERVNARFEDLVRGAFDDVVIPIPDAQVTEYDAILGYAWHLPVNFYGPTMKRVMTTSLHGRRLSDLDQ